MDLTQDRVTQVLDEPEAQLVARGLDVQVRRASRCGSISPFLPLSPIPAGGCVTLSDAGQGERFEDETAAPRLRGPAVLAHEIKNPLAAIRGAAQLVARKVGRERAAAH